MSTAGDLLDRTLILFERTLIALEKKPDLSEADIAKMAKLSETVIKIKNDRGDDSPFGDVKLLPIDRLAKLAKEAGKMVRALAREKKGIKKAGRPKGSKTKRKPTLPDDTTNPAPSA